MSAVAGGIRGGGIGGAGSDGFGPGDFEPVAARPSAERIASMNEVGSREGRSFASLEEFQASYKIRPSGSNPTPAMVRHLGRHSGRQFEDGRWRNKVDRNVYALRVGRNLVPYWTDIRIPALLMRGDRSRRIAPEIIAQVRALAPQVQVADVPGCDHHVTLDNPQGFVEVAKRWLATLI